MTYANGRSVGRATRPSGGPRRPHGTDTATDPVPAEHDPAELRAAGGLVWRPACPLPPVGSGQCHGGLHSSGSTRSHGWSGAPGRRPAPERARLAGAGHGRRRARSSAFHLGPLEPRLCRWRTTATRFAAGGSDVGPVAHRIGDSVAPVSASVRAPHHRDLVPGELVAVVRQAQGPHRDGPGPRRGHAGTGRRSCKRHPGGALRPAASVPCHSGCRRRRDSRPECHNRQCDGAIDI